MTHFNHEWDTTKTPAVPVSVGDRYYAQDLNDDFNYLKHLPYEVFLQGRSRGVMITPNDTWNSNTHTLTLSGGFGVISRDCVELDPNESFTIPPKTHSSPRYERISFTNATFILPPEEDKTYYIVATPTKRSLLQRTKTLFTEQYASRIRYDGIITIQDTAPTAGQILIGLCCYDQYCLLVDNNPDQCKDNIILKKWFGQNNITQNFVSAIQSYYNTSIASIETEITINTVIDYGISTGTFNNCTITIGTVNSSSVTNRGINGGIFNNCTISIGTVNNSSKIGIGIGDGTFNNCTISIDTVNNSGGIANRGIDGGTFNNCTITIGTVNSSSGGSVGIGDGTFNNCTIIIGTVNNSSGVTNRGINGGTFNNCTITIGTVNNSSSVSIGIGGGTFNNCTITIGTVNNSSIGVYNDSAVKLYLTRINCTAVTNLSETWGKLNVLNQTVLHAS